MYNKIVCVILFNFDDKDFQVKKGDRIAQMIIDKITPTEIEVVDSLDDTERGQNGVGSTGGFGH